MIKDLQAYLKGIKKTNLKKLENIIESFVVDPSGNLKEYDIKIRTNPAFHSKARISPERETRKVETITLGFKSPPPLDCIFCDPKSKTAKFSKETGLQEQYYLNDSAAFSNLFTFGKVHGVVLYNYKKHVKDPRDISASNWADGIKLVQQIGLESKKNYVSSHVNFGVKAASSIEHFHGQFHCEDEPLSRTARLMKFGKRQHWKSWIKALDEHGLVLDFDKDSKTVLFVEWSPVFGKTELVIVNLETPCFQNMNDNEVKAVSKFLTKAVKITMENVSDQFNIVNLSGSCKDNFCNQFRIFPRSPLSHGVKSWEGYLESMGETVPHILPEKLAEIARKY
jgi:diadenosine tetraphosphate (Ap4A) HIT family hydrolase